MTQGSARLGQALGDCSNRTSQACIEHFIQRFARLAYGRPIQSSEVRFLYDRVYQADGIDAEALSDVVTVLLSSAEMLYHVEGGRQLVSEEVPDIYWLGDFELANRLSSHFWRSGPDETLIDLAEQGRLRDPEIYRSQVRRMVNDERTRRTLDQFFAEWLGLYDVPELDANQGREDFRAFAGGDLPDQALTHEVIQEALDFIRYQLWTESAPFEALMTARHAVVHSSAVASLYGDVPLYQQDQPAPELPHQERAGILTRVAMLANNQAVTRPIHRGAVVLKRLLCAPVAPPDDLDPMSQALEAVEGPITKREEVERLTEIPNSSCYGCHIHFNQYGFALEQYDALGRIRTTERQFDGAGQLVAELPLDVESSIMFEGDNINLRDAVHMSEVLAASDGLKACFARQYVRFSFGRQEDVEMDGCLLESIRKQLKDSTSLADVLQSIALHPSFQWVKRES